MRIVRYDSQERVDLPDITAMSFLVLGEFRRTVRGLLLGPNLAAPPDHLNFIVRGFAVEPQAVPDATVRVRLDPGGTSPLGFAIGGENLGSRIDFGQLIGGDGMDGSLEGNASTSLSFAGQPVGVYTVQMRFIYQDGSNDNRAFWDPGPNSEFIAATDTRHLPAIELRLSGAPSDEWITLASVNWNGATVAGGDITDLRTFALEGASPYRKATQTGAGAIADFSRSTARGANGLNEVYPVLRALARQVQDLKGQADDGQFDWFSRPYKPYDPSNLLTAGVTKTLRTLETVTYTIGDGVTCFGDFNGAGGLDACLAHIVATVSKPERIEIVLHGGIGGSGYTLNNGYLISSAAPCTLIIRAGHTLSQTNVGTRGRPRIQIDGGTLADNEFALLMTGGGFGNLELHGIEVLWTGSTLTGRSMFGANGYIRAYDCQLLMTVSPSQPDVSAGFVLASADAQASSVRQCVIRGRVQFYDPGDGVGNKSSRRTGGVIEDSRLEATQVLLHATSPLIPGADAAVGFRISRCIIQGRTSAIYTGSVATVDGRAASYLTIEDCTITYGINENGIDGRTYNGEVPFHWIIRDCEILGSESNGSHVAGAGTGGANGTGWAINLESSTDHRAMLIDNCRIAVESTDAGGIRLMNAVDPRVRDCSVVFSSHTAGGADTVTALRLAATAANFDCHGRIEGVAVKEWSGDVPRSRGFHLLNVNDVAITDCILRGDRFGDVDIAGRTDSDAAIVLDDVEDIRVRGCSFYRWNYGVATSACFQLASGATTERCSIQDCIFEGNGNYAIDWSGGASSSHGPIIQGNRIAGGANSNNLGIRLTSSAGGAGSSWVVANNTIRHNTGVGFDAIFFDNMGGGICAGNDSNADIRKTGATLIRGYKPDDDFLTLNQNLNSPNAYT